jgi:hypothetical protein
LRLQTLKCDFLVSKFAFKFNLYRYSKDIFDNLYTDALNGVPIFKVGLYKLTHSSKAPGFNP